MSKHRLLLSAATVALLCGPSFADVTISDTVNKGLITGAENADDDGDNDFDANQGNIIITSTGKLQTNTKSEPAIMVNTASYVYSAGLIENKDNNYAYGIHVKFPASDDLTYGALTGTSYTAGDCGSANSYACSFTDADGNAVAVFDLSQSGHGYSYTARDGTVSDRHAAIFLGTGSVIDLTGDGTGKYGLWIDASSADDNLAILVGDIVIAKGAEIKVKGNTSRGVYITDGMTIDGNLYTAGAITMNQTTSDATTASSLYGYFSVAKVTGDVWFTEDSVVTVSGGSAQGVLLSGGGIGGSVTLDGTILVRGIQESDAGGVNTDNPEGGIAFSLGSSVAKGVMIGDQAKLTSRGSSIAMLITPSLTGGMSSQDTVESLVIGRYDHDANPGFGLYNLGEITIKPMNRNTSVTAAVEILGGGELYPTIIEGGIYNSGTISAEGYTNKVSSTVSTTALFFSGYVTVGGTYSGGTYATGYTVDEARFSNTADASTGLYDYASGTYSYTGGGAAEKTGSTNGLADQAAFVNSGKITAHAYGMAKTTDVATESDGGGGGSARAMVLSAYTQLSSIINTGDIVARVDVNDDVTDTVTSAVAYGIVDYSGSLTYIRNLGGTIGAYATQLDSDTQVEIAIALTGNSKTASGEGVTIISEATATKSAMIHGNVIFGDGDKQQIYLVGYDAGHTSQLIGDIAFGSTTYPGALNDNLLYIGDHSSVVGKVTATNDVAIQVMGGGSLTLLNETAQTNVSNLYVASTGMLSIAVSDTMQDTGAIDASGTVTIEAPPTGTTNIEASYNSWIPQGSEDYILIRAKHGELNIAGLNTTTSTLDQMNAAIAGYADNIDDNKPWLFASTGLEVVPPKTAGDSYDELVLSVTTKTADDLNLTGHAGDMYGAVNTALSADRDLGSAMLNDIVDDATAQDAYAAFAPNASGATRAIALSLSDQATGVVAARQRVLRSMNKIRGGMTVWAQGFGQTLKQPNQGHETVALSNGDDVTRDLKHGFKAKGVGFALGADWGSPRFGWYGGAITFFNADVVEVGRDSRQNQQWVVGSVYSTWRGRGFFFDSKVDAGIGHIKGKRFLTLTDPDDSTETFEREARNAHAATFLSGGISGGAILDYAGFSFTPHVSLDGLVMREEGYTEINPDNAYSGYRGFDLAVKPYYARSLRGYVGTGVGYDFGLWGVTMKPGVHFGYRYDLYSDAIKLHAAFRDIDTNTSGNQNGEEFTLLGPDPSKGNLVAGTSLGARGRNWTLDLNYDLVRGEGGAYQQTAVLNLMVRM